MNNRKKFYSKTTVVEVIEHALMDNVHSMRREKGINRSSNDDEGIEREKKETEKKTRVAMKVEKKKHIKKLVEKKAGERR